MSRLFNWILGFGLIGWAVASYITPKFLGFLVKPPVSFGAGCDPTTDWVMSRFQSVQVIAVGVFMVIGLVAGFISWRNRRSSKKLKEADGLQKSQAKV
jgi:hypothetical protein